MNWCFPTTALVMGGRVTTVGLPLMSLNVTTLLVATGSVVGRAGPAPVMTLSKEVDSLDMARTHAMRVADKSC